MEGKKTPLYDTHVAYGGKIVEFGGWLLPVQYSGIIEEHNAVRNAAGLFDVSHMGEIWVEGKEAEAYVQQMVTNDISGMVSGQIRYSPMCYADGGTVDDLLVYKFSNEEYLLVVNAANIPKDWEWLRQNSGSYAVKLTDRSEETAQLALQGPAAEQILARLTTVPLEEIKYYHFLPDVEVAGKKTLVSRTGYTGEDGFEIYCAAQDVTELWSALMAAGKEDGLVPTGLGARDTLRFEACLPLYGHELSADISPLKAGLGIFVKTDKDVFIGKEPLKAEREAGPAKKIIGLEIVGRGIARAGYPVKSDGKDIGIVTTGSPAPSLGKNLALALVEAAYAEIGKPLAVEIRGKDVEAITVRKPFYKRK